MIPRLLERPRVWSSADFDPSGFEARSEKSKIKTGADSWQRDREVREPRLNFNHPGPDLFHDPWNTSRPTHQLDLFQAVNGSTPRLRLVSKETLVLRR